MSTGADFVALPDPGHASNLDELAEELRRLKSWAGEPSYEVITNRVNLRRGPADQVGKTTVADCFRPGRRRLDPELITAVVDALHSSTGYVNQWRQALKVITGAAPASGQVRVSDTLPAEPPVFVGRDDTVGRLRRSVTGGDPPVLATLAGMAGVGKTQLAIRLGHLLLRDKVVEQVLFVNLRGFHPDESQPPADPAAVLDGILRSLGVPGQLVPATLPERITLYREQLAGRRILLVLDNAADEEQVRPLVPGVPGGVVLITSRRSLSLPAATRVEVGVFTPEESRRYLLTTAGKLPVGDDRRAVDRITGRCGHLPLALALVAGQMRAKPEWTLTDHADWLDETHQAGRLDSGIALAFDVSYRTLTEPRRRLLRALALHPGQSFEAGAAAALAGDEPQHITPMLGDLVDNHLVESHGAGRFGLHDLIRDFAADRGLDDDRRTDRRAAIGRLLDHYLAVAALDMNRMDPGWADRRPAVPVPAIPAAGHADPGAWLDTELSNLTTTVLIPADQHDRPDYPIVLSSVLSRYFTLRAQHQAALLMHGRAALAARLAGDGLQQARSMMQVAATELHRARYFEALDHIAVAERLFAESGDEAGRLKVLTNRAIAKTRIGRHHEARRDLLEALDLRRHREDRLGMLNDLINLGATEYGMGLFDDAATHFEAALEQARTAGDTWATASVLCNLGGTEVRQGRLDEAEAHLAEALRMGRALANKLIEGSVLDFFGRLYRKRGDYERAVDCHQQAVTIATGEGYRYGERTARNGLGDVALATGDLQRAIDEFTRAYEGATADDADDVEEQARAQTGLCDTYVRLGNAPEAIRHGRQARELWTGINDTEADRLGVLLATLTTGHSP